MKLVTEMINKKWDIILNNEFKKEYFKKLGIFIKREYSQKEVYPPYKEVFNALKYTDYDDVKVVIIGQDPYHGESEAHGLAFSVKDSVKRPPSLVNIIKELESDLGIKKQNNDLTNWAKDGVLLLNSIMTVVKDKPLSHKDKGWELFTDSIIAKLNKREEPLVFVLWGGFARSKKELITNPIHKVIEGVHPSPLSAHRGFFGSKPFSQINKFLIDHSYDMINW
jgi:uracil-DNA glycosylase